MRRHGQQRLGVELGALSSPRELHHDRQTIRDDVEEASRHQPEEGGQHEKGEGPGLENLHGLERFG